MFNHLCGAKDTFYLFWLKIKHQLAISAVENSRSHLLENSSGHRAGVTCGDRSPYQWLVTCSRRYTQYCWATCTHVEKQHVFNPWILVNIPWKKLSHTTSKIFLLTLFWRPCFFPLTNIKLPRLMSDPGLQVRATLLIGKLLRQRRPPRRVWWFRFTPTIYTYIKVPKRCWGLTQYPAQRLSFTSQTYVHIKHISKFMLGIVRPVPELMPNHAKPLSRC